MNNDTLESAFSEHRSTLMKNILVKPYEGTVLDQVVSNAPAFYKDTDTQVAKAVDPSTQYSEVQTAVANVSEHLSSYQNEFESNTKLMIDEEAKKVADVVSQQLAFVKEVVNPICVDFVQKYNSLTQEPLEPSADFDLIKIKSNPILSNSSLVQSMIQEYDNAIGEKKVYPTGYFPLPVMTYAQVCETIVGYFSDTGKDVFDYLQSLDESIVMSHLGNTFNWPVNKDSTIVPSPRDGDTIMYLFASAMYNNPIQGTDHVLGNYNDRMKSYIISCGYTLIKYHLKEYMSSLSNRQVIGRIHPGKVYLNELAYEAFIQGGGDDLRILGFVVSKEHVTLSTIDELTNNAALYDGNWSRYVLNKKTEYDIRAANKARQTYIFLAEKIIQENSQVIKDYCTNTGRNEDVLIKNYYSVAKTNQVQYQEHMLSEPQRMAMELVGTLFLGSSVKNIYSISLDVESANPNYTPQEIWQVTAYKYICEFFFNQIFVYRK